MASHCISCCTERNSHEARVLISIWGYAHPERVTHDMESFNRADATLFWQVGPPGWPARLVGAPAADDIPLPPAGGVVVGGVPPPPNLRGKLHRLTTHTGPTGWTHSLTPTA